MCRISLHSNCSGAGERQFGYVLIELVIVFFIIGLLLSFVLPNAFDRIRQGRLEEDVSQFARTLRTVTEQAILRGKELAVVIDVTDGYYTVYESQREDKDKNEQEQSEDAITIIDRQGLDLCYIEQIDYKDGSHQYSGDLIMYATAQGWKASVVFNLIDDRDERRRFVRCDRLTARVVVSRKPLEMIEPQAEVSMTSTL